MQGKELLVLDLQEQSIQSSFISESDIPEQLNGESGFHIYHVRLLTELILRKVCENGDGFSFSEEEIRAISVASSLHDVGKSQIPSSILNHPGQLAPLEFDIVKKHTVFGENLIAQAQAGNIDSEILSYARQIARHHHERIDGTGYPDGLTGDAIPICSQVVALADAYDALTSTRHYKQAYSQDVAVQMIASGMCGVFDQALVDSLIQVVNDSSLIALRQRIRKKRAIIAEEITAPKRVLCVGNTAYLTRDFLEASFPESQIVVMGNGGLKSGGRVKAFCLRSVSLDKVFETYDFDVVIYFSIDLTYQSRFDSDARLLEEVLLQAAKTGRKMRLLYLSSLAASSGSQSPEGIVRAALEQLCGYYANHSELDVKILRLPYLYSGTYIDDYLYHVFEMLSQGAVTLEEDPDNELLFLSMQDLSDLLARLLDNWMPGGGTLAVGDAFHLTFRDLEKALASIKKVKVHFTGTKSPRVGNVDNKVLRSQYGWAAKISLLEDLPEQYSRYLAAKEETAITLWERFRAIRHKYARVLVFLELVVMFVLTEGLVYATGSAAALAAVDFRMAYIVIMALTHGFRSGLAASALSSFSWLMGEIASGTNLMTLFYEPTNWLTFVYYFLVGGLCGYIRIRNDDKIRFSQEEKRLLEEKLYFVREIYQDTYQEKRELKKQILGSKDSFGKIFDITRKLDTVQVPMLYLQAVETMETILENRSIAIYSINDQQTFGRLEVASRDTMESVTRSISLDTYAPIIAGVAGGEVWRNTQLTPEFPMYAAGIHREGKLAMLIFLWQANPEQKTLYYANLLKILKDLVQMSLLRALQYNQAVCAKQYIPGTGILNQDAFAAMLANMRQLQQRKVAQFVLLDVDIHSHTLEEADMLLSGKIRQNDTLGVLDNGHVGMLLSQSTEAELNVILPRFRDLDVEISVIP